MDEEDRLERWKQMYGEVVWAKVGNFPWWPSYIYDPDEMPAEKSVVKTGMNFIGKQYCIYYYGDNNYGFALPKFIRPYTDDNRAIYVKQKIGKRYEKSFEIALIQADKDILLPKMNRVAWHIPQPLSEIVEEYKPKIKRPKPLETDEQSDSEPYFDKLEKSEEEEPESEESEVESEASEEVVVRKRKTPTINSKDKTDEISGAAKKSRLSKGGIPVSTQKQAQSMVGNKKSAAKPEPLTVDFQQESKAERLKRLTNILEVCVAVDTFDGGRALKTIEKITAMELSVNELKDSGIALLMNELRKHSSAKISEMAKNARNQWREKFSTASKPSNPTNSSEAISISPRMNVSSESTNIAREESPRILKKPNIPDIVVPIEIKHNNIRLNSVRLLQLVFSSLSTSLMFESVIERLYGGSKTKYFECVSRFASKLQRPECAGIREMITNIPEEDREVNITAWIQESFHLVSASS